MDYISFSATLIAVISTVQIEASSGRAPLLVISVNTIAKPIFHPMVFDSSVCFFGIFDFLSCKKCYFFHFQY